MSRNSSTIAKPPLSEEQKKANHIASEQQRRQTIRGVFDQLSEIVPGMQGEARSEAKVLQATVDYMEAENETKTELKRRALDAGMSEGDFEQLYRDEEEAVVGNGFTHGSDGVAPVKARGHK